LKNIFGSLAEKSLSLQPQMGNGFPGLRTETFFEVLQCSTRRRVGIGGDSIDGVGVDAEIKALR
jgi:hypothetical protein